LPPHARLRARRAAQPILTGVLTARSTGLDIRP
jgi:hypothetical protein